MMAHVADLCSSLLDVVKCRDSPGEDQIGGLCTVMIEVKKARVCDLFCCRCIHTELVLEYNAPLSQLLEVVNSFQEVVRY